MFLYHTPRSSHKKNKHPTVLRSHSAFWSLRTCAASQQDFNGPLDLLTSKASGYLCLFSDVRRENVDVFSILRHGEGLVSDRDVVIKTLRDLLPLADGNPVARLQEVALPQVTSPLHPDVLTRDQRRTAHAPPSTRHIQPPNIISCSSRRRGEGRMELSVTGVMILSDALHVRPAEVSSWRAPGRLGGGGDSKKSGVGVVVAGVGGSTSTADGRNKRMREGMGGGRKSGINERLSSNEEGLRREDDQDGETATD
ncbi:hypothetical protein EYF80_044645 [Liparis tanakae]|uniref:Uncharacterized protein n=1 Tax=Liparis tanakae TaxID=230148 RepID=A0A4Z2FVD7_9TELE|nr:hypothetical protein EYF80_044645 [Liparis tanakae]